MWEKPMNFMLRCHILGEETPVTDMLFDMDEAERNHNLEELTWYIRVAEDEIRRYEAFGAAEVWYFLGSEEGTGLGLKEWHRHKADQMRASRSRAQAILDFFNGVPDVTPF